MLRKDVYPSEYMDDWEKFSETSLSEKEKKKYSHLNIEEITHADYVHTKRVFKDFEKKLGEYHDLYVQSNTLFLTDVFENFKNMCLMWYRYVINEIKRKQQKYQRFHLEKLINISYRWRNIAF